jgi:hypothetical protein
MMLSPIGFLGAPVIFLFTVSASDASTLYQYPVLLFTLAMAVLVPVTDPAPTREDSAPARKTERTQPADLDSAGRPHGSMGACRSRTNADNCFPLGSLGRVECGAWPKRWTGGWSHGVA